MEINSLKLIIGLGNPDKKYEKTYHNVGFLAVDFFAKNPPNSKFQSANWRTNSKPFKYLKINDWVLIKPLTFMNESGKAVSEAMEYFSARGACLSGRQGSAFGGKIKPEEILIIHDDSDIELGKYKLSFNRGAAGHHGIESIIKSLGAKNFWRLRIGIRQNAKLDGEKHGTRQNASASPRKKAEEIVLKKISRENSAVLEKVFEIIKII